MDTAQLSNSKGSAHSFFLRKFAKPMEKDVNKDHISVWRINSGGQDEIEGSTTEKSVRPTPQAIEIKPAKKLQQMRSRHGGNFVPEDASGSGRENTAGMIDGEILDAIRVEMNFAVVRARKAFQQFGKSPLRPMTAVHER